MQNMKLTEQQGKVRIDIDFHLLILYVTLCRKMCGSEN
jgi:hypothetical protein